MLLRVTHPAVEVRGLTHVYRGRDGREVRANDDVSLVVPTGQVLGLLGPNGAGKTTLVSHLLGLLRPTSGTVRVAGLDPVVDPDAVKAITGFLPQTPLAMRQVEVRRALHYTGRLRGAGERAARAQTDELLERLGLAARADAHVDQLSGGLRRLVNFGMALMGRPRLLVLDEPTNELDPHNRRLVWDVLSELRREHGTTVVLVTHNVLEAEQAVDRVAVIGGGRVRAVGTPDELAELTGRRARLELRLEPRRELTAAQRARLGAIGDVRRRADGALHEVHVARDRIPELVEAVVREVGLDHVEDFRLARPTLEDVYLAVQDGVVAPPPDDRPPPPPVRRQAKPWSRRVRDAAVAFKYLWLEQVLGVRSTWVLTALFAVAMPVAMVFGIPRMGGGPVDAQSLLYVVSGTAVFALTTEAVGALANRIGEIKAQGMVVYYASLPVGRFPFLAALVLSRLLLVLPGLFTPVVAGRLIYGVEVSPSPALLLVFPLAALAMSFVGLAIGTAFDRVDTIMVVTNLLLFVLLLAAPVLIPPESLPPAVRALSLLLPPTYAADGVRRAMTGELGGAFVVDVAALAAMCVAGAVVAARRTRWRA